MSVGGDPSKTSSFIEDHPTDPFVWTYEAARAQQFDARTMLWGWDDPLRGREPLAFTAALHADTKTSRAHALFRST